MAATNRAAKITKLITAIKKHYKPVPQPKDRSLLETLLLACLLENSLHEDAEKTLAELRGGYFDWNEVRVTTKQELAEVCKNLTDPEESAARLKATLQSLFEAFYTFDLESMKKQNLGQSIKQLEKLSGTTPFVVSYAVQNSLGGHSIAINQGLLISLQTLDVITDAEAAGGTVPGLERAVPKTKGAEVGSMLHQLGVEVGKNPYGQTARKRLLAIDPKCKDQLPKRPPPPAPKAKKQAAKPAAEKPPKKAPEKKTAPPSKPAAEKKSPPSKAPEKKTAKKKAPAKAEKPTAKKAAKKKTTTKKVVKKKKKAPAKRKPR